MADIQKGELQDNLSNTLYPHTSADIVFCDDGNTTQSKLTKYENALGSVTGKTDSLTANNTNLLATSRAVSLLNTEIETLEQNLKKCVTMKSIVSNSASSADVLSNSNVFHSK